MNIGVLKDFRGWRRRIALAVLAILSTAALAFAPTASAATWTGADTSSLDWSQANNWASGVPISPIVALSFPDLGVACDSGSSLAACYVSQDDIGALTSSNLGIDDASPYLLLPQNPSTDTITLDASTSCWGTIPECGLTAVPQETAAGQAPPDIAIPIVLGGDQWWYIDGGYQSDSSYGGLGLEADQVSGSGSTLGLEFADGGTLYATTLNTGALTAQANGLGSGYLVLEQLPGPGGTPVDAELPSAGITLQKGMTLEIGSPDTTSGPITVQTGSGGGTLIFVGQDSAPDATMAVTGQVSFDSKTSTVFDIDDNGNTPSADFSQLTATGAINFNDSTVYLDQGLNAAGACAALTTGDTVVLAAAPGGLTGDITYTDTKGNSATLAPGQVSSPIQLASCPGGNTAAVATLTYGPNTITATIVGAAPLPGAHGPTISGTAAIGNTLTTTSPGNWQGTSPMTYTYQWLQCFAGNCSPIAGATGPTYQLVDSNFGEQIEVQVTASNALGSTSTDSNALGPVANASAAGPRPAISGAARVGQALTTTPGSWTGTPSLTYQWQSCPTSTLAPSCSTIAGANTTSDTPVESDLGKYLFVLVCPAVSKIGCELSSPVGPILASLPSAAEVSSALNRLSHPTGRHAAAKLLAKGSFTTTFVAPTSGSLRVVWTTRLTTGKGRRKKTKTVIVATGNADPDNSGPLKLNLHLSPAGRSLLKKKLTGIRTTSTEKFEPAGGSWTSVARVFSL